MYTVKHVEARRRICSHFIQQKKKYGAYSYEAIISGEEVFTYYFDNAALIGWLMKRI